MNYYLLTWDYEAMIARHIVKGSGEMSPNQCSHLSKTGMETKKKKKEKSWQYGVSICINIRMKEVSSFNLAPQTKTSN